MATSSRRFCEEPLNRSVQPYEVSKFHQWMWRIGKVSAGMVLIGATMVLAPGASGQGWVNFSTRSLASNPLVYDDPVHGGYLLGATNYGPTAGTNWFGQLYAAAGSVASSANLVPVGQPVNFRSAGNAGYVQTSGTTTLGYVLTPSPPGPGTIVTIPFLAHGGPATVQLRAWWGGGTQITNYEAAVASSNPNSRWGASTLLYLPVTGDPTALPPTPPVDLEGLQGFALHALLIPPPSNAPSISLQPQSQTVNAGQDVTFNVTANGAPPLSYQWRFNDTNLAGATSRAVTLFNVQPSQAGNYSVRVTNAVGAVTSSNALLTVLVVNRPPVARCINRYVTADTNCMGVASVNSGSFDPDGDPLTITQSPPGPYLLGTNTVTLMVSDNRGGSNSCTAWVVVRDTTPPTIACPAEFVATNAHDQWTSLVSFSPVVANNCSGVGAPVCTPPSGSAFAIGSTVVICSVRDAAGNSNRCSFTVTVHPGNQPPVPVIDVSPLAHFPGETNLLVIAPNNTNALVAFDASKSYDPDDATFRYLWYEGTNLFSTQVVATNTLAVGTHPISLLVDDTFPLGTNTATVTVEVISPAQAVAMVTGLVENSGLARNRQRPLLASLDAASASFERGDLRPGVHQLGAFQNKVRAEVARTERALAQQLIQAAQEIIDALNGPMENGRARFTTIARQANGTVRLHFTAKHGKVCLVEVSTDLVTWEKIGVATDKGGGQFEFEDACPARAQARLYRVASP